MPKGNHLITADDLYRFNLVTGCEIAPDGEHVVYSVQRVDRETEKKFQNLWIVPTGGGAPRPFTRGDHVDKKARWSPDGRQIAFLSNREDEKQPQLYLIPFSGGEAHRLTDLRGEFGAFEWSPDGTRLAVQFRRKDKAAIEREQDEQKKELGVVERHVTRTFFKLDGTGFLPEERWHLWVIDAESGEATQLTDGDVHDELEPAWSPDGTGIAFRSNRSEAPDLDPDAIDLFVIPAEGGEMRKIETPVGPKVHPRFSPDGEWIAYLGKEGRGVWWKNSSLWVVPADGSGPARNLTAPFDLHTADATINDLPGHMPISHAIWSADGTKIFFIVPQHGNTVLMSIGRDGAAEGLETVIGGDGVVGQPTFDRAKSRIAYLHADMREPAEVWVKDLDGAAARKLTHVNTALLEEKDLGEIEEVWFEGPDGDDLQGWILKPPDFDPQKQYPAILEIHGGPRAQYGNFFMHEFYTLAAEGYVVAFSNPRGSQGYGEAFSKAVVNDWGDPAYADLMAWTDLVAQKPYVDEERMGVTGGSYGGYMTVWIIGHTDRFAAAVAQRCVSNLTSMYGSSDLNWSFQREFKDMPPWEDVENYWRLSPIKYIGNAATPTLVIHSEEDHRCPIEQGEQVFIALRRLGVPSEMVRFPGEPHGLSRGGRTDRRVARLGHMTRWFKRHLDQGWIDG